MFSLSEKIVSQGDAFLSFSLSLSSLKTQSDVVINVHFAAQWI